MDLPEDLGDGLVLRRAEPADAGALVAFNAEMHREPGGDATNAFIADWVRSLLAGGHPAVSPGDFLVVVDRGGEIVSSLALLPETWAYGGVPFAVGRIEFVGTRPDHRRRGLVRRQMRVAHRWCAERGVPVQAISFALGSDHPVYRAIPDRLPRVRDPFAWYLRVSDLPGFLRRVAPVLEARLAASVAPGHTGALRLGFYGDGLRLAFAGGRLDVAEAWEAEGPDDGGAWFPGLGFLQLLFGRRSLAELEHAGADCRVNAEEARVLLDALFPKRPSCVWPAV